MVCLHHSSTPAKHLLLAPVWGRILGSMHLGYIHLLCFSQDVRHPSFVEEMLTACRDVSDPSESLSCVFFLPAESRIKTRYSGGTQSWTHKRGTVGKEMKPGCSTTVLLAHDVVCRALTVWCSWMSSRHFMCFQKICLRESCLPITCPHQPTVSSGVPKTQGLWKWT